VHYIQEPKFLCRRWKSEA